MIWIPKTAEELEEAVESKAIEESLVTEFKRQLPDRAEDNWKVAKEVAGLTVHGGVLIYGVAEDKKGRPVELTPFELTKQRDRVEAIIRSSIMEPPDVEVRLLRKDGDAKGYLVVAVPASARAPHQVITGNDHRYYGRSGTLTVPLAEGEIALLYQQRRDWEQHRHRFMEEAISELEDVPFEMVNTPGLFVAVRPLGSIRIEPEWLADPLTRAAKATATEEGGSEAGFFPVSTKRRTFGVRVNLSIGGRRQWFDVTYDGQVRLRSEGIFDRRSGTSFIVPRVIGVRVRQALGLAGRVIGNTDFWGSADVGFAILGGRGMTVPPSPYDMEAIVFQEEYYVATDRVLTSRLSGDAKGVARDLTATLFHTLHVKDTENPLVGEE